MTTAFLDTLQASPVMTLLGWATTFLLHSTLLIGAAWVATRFGWVRSPHLRETLWKTALVGGLISASVQTVSGPALFVRELPVEAAATVAIGDGPAPVRSDFQFAHDLRFFMAPEPEAEGRRTLMPAVPQDLQARILGGGGLAEGIPGVYGAVASDPGEGVPAVEFSPTLRTALVSTTTWVSRHAPYLLLAVWLLGAVFALVRLLRSHLRLHRGLRGRVEVRDAQVLSLLDALRRAGAVRQPVRLTVHPRLSGPIAFGRGEICLPQRVLTDLDRDHQESVLAHELGHVVRHDPVWLTAGGVLQALFFFQPLIRTARRRLQEEAEFLCDDWAVTHTGRGLILARCLARVADWVAVRPHAAPVSGMAAGDSPLIRRVERLLDESRRPSRGLPVPARVAVLLVAVGIAALFAPGLSARVQPQTVKGDVEWIPDSSVPTVYFRGAGDGPSAGAWISPRSEAPLVVSVPDAPPRSEGEVLFLDKGKFSVRHGEPHELLHYVSARPMIGVTIGEVDEALRVHLDLDEGEGALITRVIEGGAAEEAGIEPYDIVLTCDGEAVDQQRLVELVRSHQDGETVDLIILRRGERKSYTVEVRESERGLGSYFAPEAAFPRGERDFVFPRAPLTGQGEVFVVPEARLPRDLRGLLAPETPAPQSRQEALERLKELEIKLQRLEEELEQNSAAADQGVLETLRRKAEALERDRERSRFEAQLRSEARGLHAPEAPAQSAERRREANRDHDRYVNALREVEEAGTIKLQREFRDAGVKFRGPEQERFNQALAAAVEETADALSFSFDEDGARIENDSRELRDRLRSQIVIHCERLGVSLDDDARNAMDAAVDATVVHLRYLELN